MFQMDFFFSSCMNFGTKEQKIRRNEGLFKNNFLNLYEIILKQQNTKAK